MAHQVMEEDDLHGMVHHLDPHSPLMGSGIPRHTTPAYVSGHLMTMEYEMGGHSGQAYSVPHVLPGHPQPVMMMPMNAPTPQMPMQMAQERPPAKKRGRAGQNAKDEIDGSLAAPKKRAAPKRKKIEATRTVVAKRTPMVNPVVLQSPELGMPMVGYMTNMQLPAMVLKDDDSDANLLPPSGSHQPLARARSNDETRALQRSANALREYNRRARETPPERAARRAANAARARQRRAEETPEERQRRLHREAQRQQRRRNNETERERAARRAANALRQQERRAREAMARQHVVQMREQQQHQVAMSLPQSHDDHEDVPHHPQSHYMENVADAAE